MTLQDRLEQARDDYRSLVPPDIPSGIREASRRRRWPALVAAAVILIGATAGVVAWSGRHDTQKVTAIEPPTSTSTSTSTTVPVAKVPDPPGATAPYDSQVAIVEPGPYADGQQVTVRVPDGFVEDLMNGGAQVCVVVSDAPGGPSETCDPLRSSTGGASSATETPVALSQSVFTPTGMRDCNEPKVTCRVVVRAVGNQPKASAPLSFTGQRTEPGSRVEVAATSRRGEFQVSLVGITADPSWLAFRESDPNRAAGFSPLYLQVCSFDSSAKTDGPFGENLWTFSPGDDVLPPANCDVISDQILIDPDDPEAPLELNPPTWFLGYGGWSDCRTDRCFVQVRRAVVAGSSASGSFGTDETVAAALLDPGHVSTSGTKATVEIDTAGPHRAGQEITVRVAGLPDGYATNIGVCNISSPWSCGYIGSIFGQIDNGTHTFQLPDTLACPPRSCYLELDSQGEGVPPLATAPLDTPA